MTTTFYTISTPEGARIDTDNLAEAIAIVDAAELETGKRAQVHRYLGKTDDGLDHWDPIDLAEKTR